MNSIIRTLRIIIAIMMIVSVIWIVLKESESQKSEISGKRKNSKITGFDVAMIKMTGLMEKIRPTSPFTGLMKEQKEKILNQL